MKIPATPASGTLILYSINGSHGFYGLTYESKPKGPVQVFDFETNTTIPISGIALWLPFTLDNYQTMCDKGWWYGITFAYQDPRIKPDKKGFLKKGYFDPVTKKLTLDVWCDHETYGGQTLESLILTGHLDA